MNSMSLAFAVLVALVIITQLRCERDVAIARIRAQSLVLRAGEAS